jgi:hypothetical protein
VTYADEPNHGANFHERFEVDRINHQETRSLGGTCTTRTEKFFRRLRRAEIRIHPYIAGAYLLWDAQEGS